MSGKCHKREKKPVGIVETGKHNDICVVTGVLNPGEASGIPVIQEVLKQEGDITVIDCPPGSACSVMESIMDADYCILVAEPTSFGFHNFKMIYELTQLLGKKSGVVINKQDSPYEPLEAFCEENGLPILARIPYSEEIASIAAKGKAVYEESETAAVIFSELLEKIGGEL